jgi:uncharacterized phiE125 gp8 family phage protein
MDDLLDFAVELLTGPASEPVSVDEAKKAANVVADDDDALIETLIVAARELLERDTHRGFISQTWRLTLHAFPGERRIALPRAPLRAVTEITYTDTAGTEATFAAANYTVDTARGVVWLKADCDWPSDVGDEPNGVVIKYTVGYGDDAADVPTRIKQAILMLVAHWYKNREAVNVGNITSELPLAYERIVQSLRVGTYP